MSALVVATAIVITVKSEILNLDIIFLNQGFSPLIFI